MPSVVSLSGSAVSNSRLQTSRASPIGLARTAFTQAADRRDGFVVVLAHFGRQSVFLFGFLVQISLPQGACEAVVAAKVVRIGLRRLSQPSDCVFEIARSEMGGA
jgi:hypothetical protein